MQNTVKTTTEREELQEGIAGAVERIQDDAQEQADSLITLLLMDRFRFARCGDNYYLVNDSEIIDATSYQEVFTYVEEHYDFGYMPDNVFEIIWDFGLGTFERVAMDIYDLVNEAGLDPKTWLPDCASKDEEKAIIRLMYSQLGPDFFQVQPDDREDFQEYVLPLTPANDPNEAQAS